MNLSKLCASPIVAAVMAAVTVASLFFALVCGFRLAAVTEQVKAEGSAQTLAAIERYRVDEAALVERGFETSAALKWQEEEAGFLTAQAPNGGVCVKVDRNGADGIFCTGAVIAKTESGVDSDGRELFQLLARMHNYSAQAQPASNADKYRAIQRDFTAGLESVERMQQQAAQAAGR